MHSVPHCPTVLLVTLTALKSRGQVALLPFYSQGKRRSYDLTEVKMTPRPRVCSHIVPFSIWPSCEGGGWERTRDKTTNHLCRNLTVKHNKS